MNIPPGANVVFVVTFCAVALALVLSNILKRRRS
jgi:ammonia channel protein AmtB